MIQYKHENSKVKKENEISRFSNDLLDVEQEDFENIVVLYNDLVNSTKMKDTINLLALFNKKIPVYNYSFAFDIRIKLILDNVFQFFQKNDENTKKICFETMILILLNSYLEKDSNVGYYYYQNNFHDILYYIFSSNNGEYHPKIILNSIAIYSSTCIEARNSILSLFPFSFFQQFLQARNSECMKHVIACFTGFLEYPLDVHHLSELFSLISETAHIEYDDILLEILHCIKKSMKQNDWEILFIENRLHHFIKQTIMKQDNNFKELSIEILHSYSKGFSINKGILELIINEFLENQAILNETFSIYAAKIFTNHMHRDEEREILLKQGMIFVLLIFFENGTYSCKVAALKTIIELIRHGNMNQKSLIFEFDLMEVLFAIIQSNEIQLTIDTLDALIILFQSASTFADLGSTFLQHFAKCDGAYFLTELTKSENQDINQRAFSLLNKIDLTNVQCSLP